MADPADLLETFDNVKQMLAKGEGPILVHAITAKGYGYGPAEQDPYRYHGVGAFEISSGRFAPSKPGPPKYQHVFADTLIRLAQEDERIVAITAAMADGTSLDRFQKVFPDRFYDVGIAEQHAVTFAAGLASEGMKPVPAIYSTFLHERTRSRAGQGRSWCVSRHVGFAALGNTSHKIGNRFEIPVRQCRFAVPQIGREHQHVPGNMIAPVWTGL